MTRRDRVALLYTHARTHIQAHARAHAHTSARTRTRTYKRTHAHTHIQSHARAHAHTSARTHTGVSRELLISPGSCAPVIMHPSLQVVEKRRDVLAVFGAYRKRSGFGEFGSKTSKPRQPRIQGSNVRLVA